MTKKPLNAQVAVCGPELLKAGYKVIVYNPVEPEISNAYNMLYYAKV